MLRLILHLLGLDSASGTAYLAWSGVISDLGEITLIAGIIAFLRHINCHEPGCWWMGKYPAAGGSFRFCHRHHPDFAGKPPTREHMHRRHREHDVPGRPRP
jgi:hypothetical protein